MKLRQRQARVAAGTSATRIFKRERWSNIREDWNWWAVLIGAAIGFGVVSFLLSGFVTSRLYAVLCGCFIGMGLTFFTMGGDITTAFWRIGADRERDTEKLIAGLGSDWSCEHDIEHARGNFDHVVVGPPGVFLLDTKSLSRTAVARHDALTAGRLTYKGSSFRGGAVEINERLEVSLGARAPWVQAVVVIWGDFPQGIHEENKVVYLDAHRLRDWLLSQPARTSAPKRAELLAALAEVRTTLGADDALKQLEHG